jgi:hypothetical protein
MSLPDSACPAAMTSPARAASKIQRSDVVAEPLELDGDADPVGVHGHRERGRRGVAGEAALAGCELGEAQAPAAVLGGNRGGEVARRTKLGEIIREVGVRAVQLASPVAKPLQCLRRELAGAGRVRRVVVVCGDGHGTTVIVGDPTDLPCALTAATSRGSATGSRAAILRP